MEDYGIPYSYSPLLVASESRVKAELELYKRFMHATSKGHEFARDNQAEAVQLFRPFVPNKDQKINLAKALQMSATAFGKNWGKMDEKKVDTFLNWICQNNLENCELKVSDIVTNILF